MVKLIMLLIWNQMLWLRLFSSAGSGDISGDGSDTGNNDYFILFCLLAYPKSQDGWTNVRYSIE